jgi:protein involved in polysaccharide export with SLBB domain
MHPTRSNVTLAGGPLASLKRWSHLLLATLVMATAGHAVGQISNSNRQPPTAATEAPNVPNVGAVDAGNSIQLQQPPMDPLSTSRDPRSSNRGTGPEQFDPGALEALLPKPSEFEEYVNRLAFPSSVLRPDMPLAIRRLGSGLITGQNKDGESVDYNPQVPPEYVIATGDEIVLSIWGSVDAELRLIVDRSGRISVPRVGTIMVSGVRYADLPATISQRVAQTFKNFQLSVSLGQLRGVRVFVSGFAVRPGAYTVSALSSVANAVVRAGGPSASGSFRNVQLRRGNAVVATLDFYDLLLNGDRSSDRLVQADDVVHIGPIGLQVGVIGSVNRPAVFELKPGETMADALRMAGGFAAVADPSRLALERVDERASVRVMQVDASQAAAVELRNGDVLRAFNVVTLATSSLSQNKRVRIEGEVLRPGDYVLPAKSSIDDAIRAAGGLTPGAFVFGTEFTRESVRQTQQENYDRVLRNLETELALSNSTQRITSRDEAAAQAGRSAAAAQLIDRLRTIRPTGRVVLQIPPDAVELPNLTLEDGDRLFVPSVPTSVGVFGSVFNAGNYLREDGRTLADYLRQAGGPRRGADAGSSFVLRANGTVVSNLQEKTWGSGLSSNFERLPALPGDTLFVPEELDKTTFVQYAKDWTQILAQFALGVAAFVTLTN